MIIPLLRNYLNRRRSFHEKNQWVFRCNKVWCSMWWFSYQNRNHWRNGNNLLKARVLLNERRVNSFGMKRRKNGVVDMVSRKPMMIPNPGLLKYQAMLVCFSSSKNDLSTCRISFQILLKINLPNSQQLRKNVRRKTNSNVWRTSHVLIKWTVGSILWIHSE